MNQPWPCAPFPPVTPAGRLLTPRFAGTAARGGGSPRDNLSLSSEAAALAVLGGLVQL